MSKAHQTKAPRVGRVLLDGGRGWVVLVARCMVGSPHVGRVWPSAIFRCGDAIRGQVLGRLVRGRGLVSTPEEADGIEGAAAFEISFAAVRSKGLQRHCARED